MEDIGCQGLDCIVLYLVGPFNQSAVDRHDCEQRPALLFLFGFQKGCGEVLSFVWLVAEGKVVTYAFH